MKMAQGLPAFWGPAARVGLSMLAPGAMVFVLALALAGCSGPPGHTASGAVTREIVTHTVSPGETLASIADDYYGRPAGAGYLARVNRVRRDGALPAGGIIDVPVGEEDLERYRARTEAKVYYNRGTLLADSGEPERALRELTAALETDPSFVDGRYNRGVVLLMLGDVVQATADLEEAARARPNDRDCVFALGKAYLDGGSNEAALRCFTGVLDIAPGHEDAFFASAVALGRLGRKEEAIVRFIGYLNEYPDGRWRALAGVELDALSDND